MFGFHKSSDFLGKLSKNLTGKDTVSKPNLYLRIRKGKISANILDEKTVEVRGSGPL
jgi:hypothetical protein